MSCRALAPVVGVALFAVLTVFLAAAVAGLAVSVTPAEPAVVSLDADADGTLRFLLVSGSLDARALSVDVRVNGRALAHQPPVLFFAARG